MAHKVGALIHSDMVQSLGKIAVDLTAMDVDFASFAGHKFYALKVADSSMLRRELILSLLFTVVVKRGREEQEQKTPLLLGPETQL